MKNFPRLVGLAVTVGTIFSALFRSDLHAQTITYSTIALSGEIIPNTGLSLAPTSVSSVFSPVLNNSGNFAFVTNLADLDQNILNEMGVVIADTSGDLRLVAREGGGQVSSSDVSINGFFSLVLNDNGHVAFQAIVDTSSGVFNPRGLFFDSGNGLRLVARTGDAAASTNRDFRFFNGTLALNNADQVVFQSGLSLPPEPTLDSIFTWSDDNQTLAVIEGDVAPQTADGVTFATIDAAVTVNVAGEIAFTASLTGTDVDNTNRESLYSTTGGALHLVAREGDAAPGTPFDFLEFNDPVLNDSGQTVFSATLGTGTRAGIFIETDGTLQLVADEQTSVPSIGPFVVELDFIDDVVLLNDAGQVVFLSNVDGIGINSSNRGGIFVASNGTVEVVARQGDVAPGTEPGVTFRSFSAPSLNNLGHVAFQASLAGTGIDSTNDRGIFISDLEGNLHLVAREGDDLDVDDSPDGVDIRTIAVLPFSSGSGSSDGRSRRLNEQGDVSFAASFTDGTSGVFVSSLTISIEGDFDRDGDVDSDDIDFFSGNLNQGAIGTLAQLDLNNDGQVTDTDHSLHVETLVQTSNGQVGTFFGDINLDGSVNVLGDAFALVGNLGNNDALWSDGDLNASRTVDVLGDAFRLVGNLGESNNSATAP